MRYPAFLFAVVATGVAHADELRVVDGDTFWLNGEKIRLWGIDAPELSDGGIPAKQALQQFIGHRDVTCVPKGKSYDRIVALCTAAGQDIAAWLVRNGYARDWPKYSKGYYADEQAEGED